MTATTAPPSCAAPSSGAAAVPAGSGRSRILIAAAALATLLATLLTGARSASAAATRAVPTHARTSYESYIGNAVLRELNRQRRAHHLGALRMNRQLLTSARSHDVDMAHFDAMAHQLPGEAFFATRMTRAGYHWHYAGENIAWNSHISELAVVQLQVMMYNEKAPNNGHRLNILSKHYTDVGVDVYVDSAHHKVWLTTDFGHH